MAQTFMSMGFTLLAKSKATFKIGFQAVYLNRLDIHVLDTGQVESTDNAGNSRPVIEIKNTTSKDHVVVLLAVSAAGPDLGMMTANTLVNGRGILRFGWKDIATNPDFVNVVCTVEIVKMRPGK